MRRDSDTIYERDARDVELEDLPQWPREKVPPPRIDYEPADDDEEYATFLFASEIEDGCSTSSQAEARYRAYVRRHRGGDE